MGQIHTGWWINGKVALLKGGRCPITRYLTVRNNSVANCRRLGNKISTGPEVFAMPKDEWKFESSPAPQIEFFETGLNL